MPPPDVATVSGARVPHSLHVTSSSSSARGSAWLWRPASGPSCPRCVAGAAASADLVHANFEPHRLLVPRGDRGSCSSSSSCSSPWSCSSAAGRGRRSRRVRSAPRSRASRSASARCCSPARSASEDYVAWPGLIAGVACARAGPVRDGAACSAARAPRLDAAAQAALPLYANGVALRARGARDPAPADLARRARRSGRGCCYGPAPRGPRSTRACASSPATTRARDAVPKKLVLAVIDGVKPAMLERVVATGRAPAIEAADARGHLRRRLRLGLPLGHSRVRRDDRHRRRRSTST